jgi:hypothetical protein
MEGCRCWEKLACKQGVVWMNGPHLHWYPKWNLRCSYCVSWYWSTTNQHQYKCENIRMHLYMKPYQWGLQRPSGLRQDDSVARHGSYGYAWILEAKNENALYAKHFHFKDDTILFVIGHLTVTSACIISSHKGIHHEHPPEETRGGTQTRRQFIINVGFASQRMPKHYAIFFSHAHFNHAHSNTLEVYKLCNS